MVGNIKKIITSKENMFIKQFVSFCIYAYFPVSNYHKLLHQICIYVKKKKYRQSLNKLVTVNIRKWKWEPLEQHINYNDWIDTEKSLALPSFLYIK